MVTKATKKKGIVKVGNLKLNKETVKDLTKSDAKKIKGGTVTPQKHMTGVKT